MLRILLIGAQGQVGHALYPLLRNFAEVVAPSRAELDLADIDDLRARVRSALPDLIINTAAYNDVDGAESDRAGAMLINGTAVQMLGEEARQLKSGLIHFSTDFVFDGEKSEPYVETDVTRPLSVYGNSKRAGEQALAEDDAPAIVLRTAWVYSLRRKSFVSAILARARTHETMKVVNDQLGNPTAADDLPRATALIAYALRKNPFTEARSLRGIYHLAGTGWCTRYELARAAIELDEARTEHKVMVVEPVPSTAFPTPAKRPRHAPLDCTKARETFGVALPPWRESLERALAK